MQVVYALLDGHNQKVYYTKTDYCSGKDLGSFEMLPPGRAEAQPIMNLPCHWQVVVVVFWRLRASS